MDVSTYDMPVYFSEDELALAAAYYPMYDSTQPLFTAEELYGFLPAQQQILCQSTADFSNPQPTDPFMWSTDYSDPTYFASLDYASSCEPSPYAPANTFLDPTASPVTPSGSPYAPQPYMLPQQPQQSYYVPPQAHESFFFAPSMSPGEPPALDAEDIRPVEPELRGMGLYDDAPQATRKLKLEESFLLPETMMVKDEASGKIVKRRISVDDDEEDEDISDDEEDMEQDVMMA